MSLDASKSYGPPRPVTGIALPSLSRMNKQQQDRNSRIMRVFTIFRLLITRLLSR
jgi:hypothetical protein